MPQIDHTRLVLITSLLPDGEPGREALERALSGGDVASVLIEAAGRDEPAFQDFAGELVPVAQAAGAAAIVVDDTRCAGRVKADGIHMTGGIEALGEAIARFSPRLIVGGSGFKTRHDALEAGERLPDYLLFGRFNRDDEPGAHERDLEMAGWWAAIVEIPCILVGGADLATLAQAAASRTEFIALSRAVFSEPGEEGRRVAEANRILEESGRLEAA